MSPRRRIIDFGNQDLEARSPRRGDSSRRRACFVRVQLVSGEEIFREKAESSFGSSAHESLGSGLDAGQEELPKSA